MKIFTLTIVIFAIGGYVTGTTSSLDPTDNAEISDVKNESDDARTKRSGDIFSSLLKKKLGLFGSLSGSSSGKSIDHHEPYQEPLSYNTKSFNLWGVKKAIMSSVFQAAKAITGGVIALKGQLIKAKGHVVVAKGKLMQTKGEAISNFGKTIATHAFDTHPEPHYEGPPSSIGVFNHLPVTPMHQPTSYGVATAVGYQGNAYAGNAYPVEAYSSNAYAGNAYAGNAYAGNAYQVAAPSFPTAYAVPQAGYDVGSGYGGYGANGITAKRAVQSAQESSNNNKAKSDSDKDAVRAGLVIFKPIKMPQNLQGITSAASPSAASVQQMLNQRPTQSNSIRPTDFKTLQNAGSNNPFAGFQTTQAGGYQGAQNGGYQGAQTGGYQGAQTGGYQGVPTGGYQGVPTGGYQGAPTGGYQGAQAGGFLQGAQADGFASYQNPGYQAQNAQYQFPVNSGGDSFEQIPSQGFGLQNFDFQQPANSQEFNQQLAAFSGQQPQSSYSQEINNYGSDQHDSASNSEEHVVEPVYKRPVTKTGQKTSSDRFPVDFFLPTTTRYNDDVVAGRSKKRSAPKKDDSDEAPVARDSIVPLKYHDDSNAEDQARLKQTVQRFFSMLQKQQRYSE